MDFLEQNAELRSGRFTSSFTYKTSQHCWKQIAIQLNAVGPVQKDWKQWRKVGIFFYYLQKINSFYVIFQTWQDLKTKTKAKSSELKRHRQGTGGGEAAQDLSLMEERVLGVIGSVAVSGHPKTITSNVLFEDMEMNENINTDEHSYFAIEGSEMEENVVTVNSKEMVPEETIEIIPVHTVREKRRLECLDHSKTNNVIKDPLHTEHKSLGKRRFVRTQRLDNSLKATNTLAEQMNEKLEMKKSYYDNKLQLMQEANNIQRIIASALQKIAEAL